MAGTGSKCAAGLWHTPSPAHQEGRTWALAVTHERCTWGIVMDHDHLQNRHTWFSPLLDILT